MRNLILFLPPEFAVMLIAGAGIALIAGARRLAVGLLVAGASLPVLPAVLEPLFAALPAGLLIALLALLALSLARTLFVLVIGSRSTEHMVGILAADAVRAGVKAPFWMIGWLIRSLITRR